MSSNNTTTKKSGGGRPVGLKKLPDGTYARPQTDGVTYISTTGNIYRFNAGVSKRKAWTVVKTASTDNRHVNIAEIIVDKKINSSNKSNKDPIIDTYNLPDENDEYDDTSFNEENVDDLRFRIYPIVQDDYKGNWGYTPKQVFDMFNESEWAIVAPEAILIEDQDIFSPFFDALTMCDWWRTMLKSPIRNLGMQSYWLVVDDRDDSPLFIFTQSMSEDAGTFNILNNGMLTEDKVYTESMLFAFVPLSNSKIRLNKKEMHGRIPETYNIIGLFRGTTKITKENKDLYKGIIISTKVDGIDVTSILNVSTEPETIADINPSDSEPESEDDDDEFESEDSYTEVKDSIYDYYDDLPSKNNGKQTYRSEDTGEFKGSNTGYMPSDWEIGYKGKKKISEYRISEESYMKDLGDGHSMAKKMALSDDLDYMDDAD